MGVVAILTGPDAWYRNEPEAGARWGLLVVGAIGGVLGVAGDRISR